MNQWSQEHERTPADIAPNRIARRRPIPQRVSDGIDGHHLTQAHRKHRQELSFRARRATTLARPGTPQFAQYAHLHSAILVAGTHKDHRPIGRLLDAGRLH